MKTILTFIAGILFMAAYALPNASAVEGEMVLVEYHHTKEICGPDDVGLVRLSLEDVQQQLKEKLR